MTIDDVLRKVVDEAVDEGLADALYSAVETPIGRLLVAQTKRGVCRVAFAEETEEDFLWDVATGVGPRVMFSRAHMEEVLGAFEDYFGSGEFTARLPVDLRLVRSGFRREVLQRLRRVRGGRVTTYGDLAAATGHPRAARAVGTACATNPVPILVPCHRVVPSGGGIGSYGGGAERKEWLLRLEGALG